MCKASWIFSLEFFTPVKRKISKQLFHTFLKLSKVLTGWLYILLSNQRILLIEHISVEDPMAIMALKYMLMSKVMLNLPDEVTNLVSGKLALK